MRDAIKAMLVMAALLAMFVVVGRDDAANDASYRRFAECQTIAACRGDQ